jgi:hypothetical protein
MSFDIKADCNAEEANAPEEIVAKLRQIDVLVSQGQNIAEAIRQIGVSELPLRSNARRRNLLHAA